MLTQRPTPAFMSQEAARRLPRFALALLLAVFILSSFWADGLWTLRDAAGFGVAQSMTNGGLEAWLLPQIQGTPEAEIGPLAGWAAALFMKLFSELLGEIGAYRLTSVFWFLFTSVAVWSTAWRLARRAEAQPVAFAFGGQAAPVSFARTTASCAVLFFVASFGIATRQYEPIADTALVAAAAWALYGAAWALRRPFVGAFVSGLAAGGAALTTSFACGFWLFLSALAAQAVLRALGGSRLLRISFTVLGFAAPLIFCSPPDPFLGAGVQSLARVLRDRLITKEPRRIRPRAPPPCAQFVFCCIRHAHTTPYSRLHVSGSRPPAAALCIGAAACGLYSEQLLG